MEDWHLEKYEQEVRRQARYAQMAWADLQNAVASKDDERVCYSVQSFLVAAANISKLFWPPANKPDSKQRGEALRSRFAMNAMHILEDRKLRNHFEHFDERLDDWRNLAPPYFIDSNVYPANQPYARITHVQGQAVKETRALHPDCSIRFHGEKYDLEAVMEAINNLRIV